MNELINKRKYLFIILFLIVLMCFVINYKEYLNSDILSFTIGELKFTAYSVLVTMITVGVLIIASSYFLKYSEKRIRNLPGLKASNKEILIKILYIAVLSIASLTTLGILGIDMTALAVFSGSIGIGIGFGLQKVAANYITGIILLFEKSFEIGDLIELNDKTIGFVNQIGGRYILIKTFDGKVMMIPNEEFINYKIINWTHKNSHLRLEIEIEISPQENIEKIKQIILDVAYKSVHCLNKPVPFCVLKDISDGKIIFALLFWADNIKLGFLIPKSEIKLEIWIALQKNNIQMPVPIRQIIKKLK